MISIKVQLNSQMSPMIFNNVEEYYDGWRTLEIVQLELYKTVKTRINKANVIYYTIHDTY